MGKRFAPDGGHSRNQRRRIWGSLKADTRSVWQRAQKYVLATAELPLNVLSYDATEISCRPSDDPQVKTLLQIFQQDSVRRDATAHFLLVQCRREAVQRMKQHLMSSSGTVQFDTSQVLSFRDWKSINPRDTLEVLVGRRRIEALKCLVNKENVDRRELWWTCIIYDQEELPPDIGYRLRFNRATQRTDSHAELWTQAALAECYGMALFRGDENIVLESLRRELRLGSQFPVSLMATLWANDSWRTTLTRWSETALGRDNFDIARFSHLLGLKVDGFWLGSMTSALDTLDTLPDNTGKRMVMDDWKLLVQEMPRLAREERAAFFFPNADTMRGQATLQRRPGFLQNFDNDDYAAISEHLQNDELLRFSDIDWLLKINLAEADIMARVLEHVVGWFDETSSAMGQWPQNMKPQLRDSLRPVLQRFHKFRELDMSQMEMEEEVERHSKEIEWSVMMSVRKNMKFFQSSYGQATLQTRLQGDQEGYSDRFERPEWEAVLSVVEELFLEACPRPWPSNVGESSTTVRVRRMTRDVRRATTEIARSLFGEDEPQGGEAAMRALQTLVGHSIQRWGDVMARRGSSWEEEIQNCELGETVLPDGNDQDSQQGVSGQRVAAMEDASRSILQKVEEPESIAPISQTPTASRREMRVSRQEVPTQRPPMLQERHPLHQPQRQGPQKMQHGPQNGSRQQHIARRELPSRQQRQAQPHVQMQQHAQLQQHWPHHPQAVQSEQERQTMMVSMAVAAQRCRLMYYLS